MDHPIPTNTADLPKPRPYAERNIHELVYIRRKLQELDEAVPVDLDAAIVAKGGILD